MDPNIFMTIRSIQGTYKQTPDFQQQKAKNVIIYYLMFPLKHLPNPLIYDHLCPITIKFMKHHIWAWNLACPKSVFLSYGHSYFLQINYFLSPLRWELCFHVDKPSEFRSLWEGYSSYLTPFYSNPRHTLRCMPVICCQKFQREELKHVYVLASLIPFFFLFLFQVTLWLIDSNAKAKG